MQIVRTPAGGPPAAFLFAESCIIVLSVFFCGGARRYFRSDILFIYNMIWPCTFCGAVFVSPQSPNTDNILDQFSYCPLSGDLHVTFANPEIFGFEFHLRSSPCEFSRRSVNQPVALLLAATTRRWQDPRSKQLSTFANSWLSVRTLSYRYPLRFSFLRTE